MASTGLDDKVNGVFGAPGADVLRLSMANSGTYPLWHAFTDDIGVDRPPLRIVAGYGPWLRTDGGRRLLNGFSGLSAICGLRHPAIDAAVRQQLATLSTCSLFRMTHPGAEQLGQALVDLCFGGQGRALLLNSGAETVEAAVKAARAYHALRAAPRRRVVFTFHRSYHGSSLGTMGLSGIHSADERRLYGADHPDLVTVSGPMAGDCPRCGPGPCHDACLDALVAAIDEVGAERAAAVVVEPVFAAGGVIEPAPAFFHRLRAVCDATGMLLICDESATGLGRTGTMLGAHRTGLRPDAVVLAKALSGGYLPLGALVVAPHVVAPFLDQGVAFPHGSSSSGNPLAIAAALATLDTIWQDDYPGRAATLGTELAERLAFLADHELVRQVRVVGLMCAVELNVSGGGSRPSAPTALRVNAELIDAGLITHVKRDRVAFFPPINIDSEHIEIAVDAFGTAFGNLGRESQCH